MSKNIILKIALIGNMNNNNFALLRYFRELGADVDLYLMSDDGKGDSNHFSPEHDTWDINKWSKYIKYINVPNRFVSVIGNNFPWNIYFWLKYYLFFFSKRRDIVIFKPINRLNLKKELLKYDKIVASGLVPAILQNININIDVFYPYSLGVEFVNEHEMQNLIKNSNFIIRKGATLVRNKQVQGILNTKKVINIQMSETEKVFKKIGKKTIKLQLPIFYREPKPNFYSKRISQIFKEIEKFKFRFISHTRHLWVNNNEIEENIFELECSKHNDWIIRAFADYLKLNPKLNSILILSSYGTDWKNSQKLCRDLNIQKNVIWLPKLPRIEVLEIISICHVGIGEFYSSPKTLWGGAGLEIMSCGIPLIHSFIFKPGEYEKIYKHKKAPICIANSQKEILDWLVKLTRNKVLREKIGLNSLSWFQHYNGKGLAKKVLKLILE